MAVLKAEAEGAEKRRAEAAVRSLTDRSSPPPTPEPLYKKWWLWAGVGALATGAIVYAVIPAHPRSTTREGAGASKSGEEAVLVHLKLSNEEMGTSDERQDAFALQDELIRAIEAQGEGEFDGNEFGDGFCTFYLYGSSADRLFKAILPVLTSYSSPPGSYVIKRYGPPGAREQRVELALR